VDTWGKSYNNAPEEMRQSRFSFRAGLELHGASRYRSFLAYVDGEPVATSELFLGAGVAAVMWVGTIPAARGKGIGAAITLAPLLEARRLGYRIGALTASPRGYHVYQQMGFKEMCRIPVYRWVPEGW
jgi:GNAT superfamily N-acetyltransferase